MDTREVERVRKLLADHRDALHVLAGVVGDPTAETDIGVETLARLLAGFYDMRGVTVLREWSEVKLAHPPSEASGKATQERHALVNYQQASDRLQTEAARLDSILAANEDFCA